MRLFIEKMLLHSCICSFLVPRYPTPQTVSPHYSSPVQDVMRSPPIISPTQAAQLPPQQQINRQQQMHQQQSRLSKKFWLKTKWKECSFGIHQWTRFYCNKTGKLFIQSSLVKMRPMFVKRREKSNYFMAIWNSRKKILLNVSFRKVQNI